MNVIDTEAWKGLTEPQKQFYISVQALGIKVVNGRARRTVEALEAAGLVEVDWDIGPPPQGQRHRVHPAHHRQAP